MSAEYVCNLEDFTERRVHKRLQSGRFVTIVQHGDGDDLYCIDSNCYHMGGPLGAGDIEDVIPPSECQERRAVASDVPSSPKILTKTSGGDQPDQKSNGLSGAAVLRSLGNGFRNVFAERSASDQRDERPSRGKQSENTSDRKTYEPTILCPWHRHRISLISGAKYTESVKPVRDPLTGAMKMERCGLQASTNAFQQVHRVVLIKNRVYVAETEVDRKKRQKVEDTFDMSSKEKSLSEGTQSSALDQEARESCALAVNMEASAELLLETIPAPPSASEHPYAFDEHCAANLISGSREMHSRKYRHKET